MSDAAGDHASQQMAGAMHSGAGVSPGKALGAVLIFAGLILLPGLLIRGEANNSAAQGAPDDGGTVMEQDERDRRIDYIELPATDVEAMKRFYGGVFGWTFEDYGPEYASFSDGRMSGGLRKEPKIEPGGPLIVLFASDLKGMEALVRKHNGGIVKEIFEFPGGRRFHFADPSGNELAVWSDR